LTDFVFLLEVYFTFIQALHGAHHIDMPIQTNILQQDVYRRLKKGFNRLSAMLSVHLEDTLLYEMGVDHIQVDLEDETERGGPYFLPMSQERIDALNRRPEVDITFDEDWSSSVWCFSDAETVHLEFRNQLYSNIDESAWKAWEGSHWQPRLYVVAHQTLPYLSLILDCRSHKSRYQMLLWESGSLGYTLNPRRQFYWHLEDHFAAEGFPHRSCISRAGIPDVKGLTRGEMMIVTGMMIAAMREKGAEGVLVVPVCQMS
jgi:hypothetical protein